tara:strand:+ start:2061 stop:2267 length:207 start_codon:yes stop_codon:yes gene_type:complete
MTLFGKICLVAIISFFALIGALGSANPWPCFLVAWSVWIIFILSIVKRKRRDRDYDKEKMIREILDKL